jgi:DNA-binding response OmpR family regulator
MPAIRAASQSDLKKCRNAAYSASSGIIAECGGGVLHAPDFMPVRDRGHPWSIDMTTQTHETTKFVAQTLTPVPGHGRAMRLFQPQVLIVDDDPSIRAMVADYFEQHDIRAAEVPGRRELQRRLALGEPSLIILDLSLGAEDGLDLLRELRARSDVPVIITTGHRREEIDRVVALELGADDYVIKPFGLRELLARGRAVLRRHEMGRAGRGRSPERGGYRFAGWLLERRSRRLFDPSGRSVELTKSDYALLLAFLQAPQRPLAREHLLQATRIHEDILDRSIDVQVLRLRRKLAARPGAPVLIRTERGVGYVFDTAVEPF